MQIITQLLSEAHWQTIRAIRAGDKKAIREAKTWEAECWEAAMIVRRYRQRVLLRQDAGITALDRLNTLRNDIADQMDVDMMRTP